MKKIKQFFKLNYTRVKFFILRKLGLYKPMTAQEMHVKFVESITTESKSIYDIDLSDKDVSDSLNSAQRTFIKDRFNKRFPNKKY